MGTKWNCSEGLNTKTKACPKSIAFPKPQHDLKLNFTSSFSVSWRMKRYNMRC